jgi:hypothetical protein
MSEKSFELNLEEVQKTIFKLNQRISDRFPNSGLSKVCSQLGEIAGRTKKNTAWLRRPLYLFRVSAWMISLTVVIGPILGLIFYGEVIPRIGLTELIQVSEALINDIVLIGAAIFFMLSMETRFKRRKALAAIHELRSVGHVIDMHQLTKDPERIGQKTYIMTPSSPTLTMTRFQLNRYLDYCSELLSLTAKIGAVYAQDYGDTTVLTAVSDLEHLTTDLSRKIWQKITVIHSMEEPEKPEQRIITGE